MSGGGLKIAGFAQIPQAGAGRAIIAPGPIRRFDQTAFLTRRYQRFISPARLAELTIDLNHRGDGFPAFGLIAGKQHPRLEQTVAFGQLGHLPDQNGTGQPIIANINRRSIDSFQTVNRE